MNKIIEYLKSLFGDDKEKEKIINDFANEIETQIKEGAEKQNDNNNNSGGNISEDDQKIQRILSAFESMKAENKKLNDALADVLRKESEREAMLKTKAQKELEDKITKAIEEANKDGRIPPKNEELNKKYKALLEKDYDTAIAIIEALPKQANEQKENSQESSAEDPENIPSRFISRQKLVSQARDAFETED